jgi:ribonuclease HI
MNNNYITIKGIFMPNSTLLQFDGLSYPNPGISTSGAVLFDHNNKVIFEVGEYIGFATNNQAEYNGLIIGLQRALELNIKNILIEGDSKLIIYQSAGKWKVNNEDLKQ